MTSEDDDAFVNTPSEWETESEEAFLNRLLETLNDSTLRSSMKNVIVRLFILERIDAEFAKNERAGLIGPPPWAKGADDIPSGVVFRNSEDWECVWVSDGDGNRTLHYAEMVPVKYEAQVKPIEDPEDAEWAISYGPYLEVTRTES